MEARNTYRDVPPTLRHSCSYKHRLAKRKGRWSYFQRPSSYLAPQVGLEPTTLRLTAECSAIELLRNECGCTVREFATSRNGFITNRCGNGQGELIRLSCILFLLYGEMR